MPGCCDSDGYQAAFSGRKARRASKRFDRDGLDPSARGILNFVISCDIDGATVLEIGGGIGQCQIELLRHGASHVTNLEISHNYETVAARLLGEAGLTGRVTRRFLDIAKDSDQVEAADIVVMHRVVCCYPDYAALLTASAARARRAFAYSYPPANPINRVQFGAENVYRWLTHNDFRTFIHPAENMLAAVESEGMTVAFRRHARDWDAVGLVR